MIKTINYNKLPNGLHELLEQYTNEEFGHVPFVQQHEWATPDWVILRYEAEELVTFYNVVLREITLNGRGYKAAGINNVITPKAYRGKGYSTDTLLSLT